MAVSAREHLEVGLVARIRRTLRTRVNIGEHEEHQTSTTGRCKIETKPRTASSVATAGSKMDTEHQDVLFDVDVSVEMTITWPDTMNIHSRAVSRVSCGRNRCSK